MQIEYIGRDFQIKFVTECRRMRRIVYTKDVTIVKQVKEVEGCIIYFQNALRTDFYSFLYFCHLAIYKIIFM